MVKIVTWFLLAALMLPAGVRTQGDDESQKYQNTDPPGCGSFHVHKIQGTVINQAGEPAGNAGVLVFDDASRNLLGRAVADASGRFLIGQEWKGRLRLVFFSKGYLRSDWAVTITKWPDGGFFRSKAMRVVLPLPAGDGVPICRGEYSKR